MMHQSKNPKYVGEEDMVLLAKEDSVCHFSKQEDPLDDDGIFIDDLFIKHCTELFMDLYDFTHLESEPKHNISQINTWITWKIPKGQALKCIQVSVGLFSPYWIYNTLPRPTSEE